MIDDVEFYFRIEPNVIFFVLLDIFWAILLDTPKTAKWNMANSNETMSLIVNKPNDRAHTIMTNRMRAVHRKSLMPTHTFCKARMHARIVSYRIVSYVGILL